MGSIRLTKEQHYKYHFGNKRRVNMNNFVKPNKILSINKMKRMRKKEIFNLIKDKQVKDMVKNNGLNYYNKDVLCDILNFELNI